MLHQWHIDNPQFWKVLQYLEGLTEEKSLQEVCYELGTQEDLLLKGIFFLQRLDHTIQLKKRKKNKIFLCPPKQRARVLMDMGLLEYVSLQAHFPLLEQNSDRPYYPTLIDKLIELETTHKNKDLSEAELFLSSLFQGSLPLAGQAATEEKGVKSFLQELELAILNKFLVVLVFGDHKRFEVFPQLLKLMEGVLVLVGEDTDDRCITSLEVIKILEIERIETHQYRPNFSRAEVSDFIDAIQAVGGNGVRLVLKIHSLEKVQSPPLYQFCGNPYITTNGEGEYIWAATVEPCEEIFHWIESLGQDVEILDPLGFKKEYGLYLQKKSKKAG